MTKPLPPISSVMPDPESDWQFYLQAGVGLHEEPARSSWMAQGGVRCEYEIIPQLRIFSEANFSRSIKHWVTTQTGHMPYDNPQMLLDYNAQKGDQIVQKLGFSRNNVVFERKGGYLEKSIQQGNEPLYRMDIPLGVNVDSFIHSHLSFDLFTGAYAWFDVLCKEFKLFN
jgi:hypothetical protein